MATDIDELFKTLEKGFDKMESGMTDKTRRMDMKMENMHNRLEKKFKEREDRLKEKMGSIKTRGNISINGRNYTGDSQMEKLRMLVSLLKWLLLLMFTIVMFFVISSTFNNIFNEHKYKMKDLAPAPIEETVKPDSLKKL